MAETVFSSPIELLLKGGYLQQPDAEACQAVADKAAPGPRRPARPLLPLGQLPDPVPEEKNPAALFRRGWLRKGGGAFLIAPSGVGKSVWTIQAAISWALGKPFFGLEPVRPLKIVVIQAEDDREEVAFFRNEVSKGLVEEFGFDEWDVRVALGTEDPASARVFFYQAVGLLGEAFVNELGAILDSNPDVDLVIVNPFQSYFGGDCSRNSELSGFLRGSLDREIKDPSDTGKDRAAVFFAHHTNKPPNDKDLRDQWGNDQFAAYIGAGGAEIVNWARAILSLMPSGVPGVFRLIAGKRGQRTGWIDQDGKPVFQKLLKHADNGGVFWRQASQDDEEAVRGCDGKGPARPPVKPEKFGVLSVVSFVDANPGLSGYAYRSRIADVLGCSDSTVLRKLDEAVAFGLLSVSKVSGKGIYEVTEEGRNALKNESF